MTNVYIIIYGGIDVGVSVHAVMATRQLAWRRSALTRTMTHTSTSSPKRSMTLVTCIRFSATMSFVSSTMGHMVTLSNGTRSKPIQSW
jgi:hypothetical protein